MKPAPPVTRIMGCDGAASFHAAVGVFETDDVVLAKIAAGLHLDDLERNLARVGQAVDLAEGNVGALVLAEDADLVAVRDLGRAADDDPVLGPVVVLLQAERCARLDHDPLDLEARTGVDAVVPAPGAMHLSMQGLFGAAGPIELADDVLD